MFFIGWVFFQNKLMKVRNTVFIGLKEFMCIDTCDDVDKVLFIFIKKKLIIILMGK